MGRRGPNTPKWVATDAGQAYLELHQETGLEPTGKEVRERLRAILVEKNQEHILPSLSQIYDILQRMRPGLVKLEDEAKGIDEPWSLGASLQFDIPAEASSDLLTLWAWCVTHGETLSVREARWAAWLKGILLKGSASVPKPNDTERRTREGEDRTEDAMPTDLNPAMLYSLARRYAWRERAAKALGNLLDTRDLDALLALEPEELHEAAVETGTVPASSNRSKADQSDKPPAALPEFREVAPSSSEFWKLNAARLVEQGQTTKNIFAPFQDLGSNRRHAAPLIWNLWMLAFARKGTKWGAMSKGDRLQAMELLANEVAAHLHSREELEKRLNAYAFEQTNDMPDVGYIEAVQVPFGPSPGLLEYVGYQKQRTGRHIEQEEVNL